MHRSLSTAVAGVVALALAAQATPQPDMNKPIENPPYGTVFLSANVGSFKILSRGATPAQGTLTMSFSGTVLVAGLSKDGRVSTEGKVIREYQNEKYNRQVFHGTGRIVVRGKFGGLQWFGRNMSARFDGYAVIRAFGEFDKNLETGRWWYPEEPDKKRYWSPNGATPISVPRDRPIEAPGMKPPTRRTKDDD